MAVLRWHHVQIAAPEGSEPAARAFYGRLLGLEEVPKPPMLAGRGGVWFRSGALELHVGADREFVPARRAHPAFEVDEWDALRARLRNAGTALDDDASPFPGRMRFYCRDPFGNRLEFVSVPGVP